MGRYTGPVERLSRREGVELHLKGARALNGKSALARRGPVPPGGHRAGARRTPSTYGRQLRAKQLAKRYYGVRERQFRRYVREAGRGGEGRIGEELLALLERRLDNTVYRLGLATTRAQARQFVSHGHVLVDGRRVTIASYSMRPGQLVEIRRRSAVEPLAREAAGLAGAVGTWLEADRDRLCGRMLRLPQRPEIPAPIEERLIVELYSRR